MSSLTELIAELSNYAPLGTISQPSALGFIKNYKGVVNTLQKINNMIGLESLKNSVAEQFKFFIVNYRRFGQPTHKEMLNVLIYGPPGTGKSQIGKLLAQLWAYSGCLPNVQKKQELKPNLNWNSDFYTLKSLNNNLAIENRLIKNQIQEYQNVIQFYFKNIKELHELSTGVISLYNNVRKKMRARIPEQEGFVQSRCQELKNKLKFLNKKLTDNEESKQDNIQSPDRPLLPVVVPNNPGKKSLFGTKPIPTNTPAITPEEEEDNPADLKFCVLTRRNLIGQHQGHTTEKLSKIFEQYEGGVIFIDEAYSLQTSEHDDFGMEIVTEITSYMSTNPDKIIFILAGYRKNIEDGIFKYQPGLARRFDWSFEIEDYTSKEVCDIFQQQLEPYSLKLKQADIQKIQEFFKANLKKFPYFGGDTGRLCKYIKEKYYDKHWKDALDDNISTDEYQSKFSEIGLDVFESAYNKYLENSVAHRQAEEAKRSFDNFQKTNSMYI